MGGRVARRGARNFHCSTHPPLPTLPLTRTLCVHPGHVTENTQWNAGRAASIVTPRYSLDSRVNPATTAAFSPTELTNIITIFRGVAEDFAPFDADVTTHDDGAAPALRCVFGGRGEWFGDAEAGGAAIHDSFASAQPVFVFTASGSMSNPKIAWEAASHYIGHSLVSEGWWTVVSAAPSTPASLCSSASPMAFSCC